MSDLVSIQQQALAAIDAAGDLTALDEVRVSFTGRRSDLVAIQQTMGSLSADGRKDLGQALNAFKAAFESAFSARHAQLEDVALATRLEAERLDLTLPPRRLRPGRPHLLTQVEHEIIDVFIGLGYRVADGPEVEAASLAFDYLNIPPDHPARQEMDTIYVRSDGGVRDVLLRPHTSPVQTRTMLAQKPPIAIVAPGRVYRQDTLDATHSPVFTQVEALLVDVGITMADLRGTLEAFARALFGDERDVRLRPSMFPFTEPSAEVDVSCGFCAGDGAPCRVCSGTGWIEILGSGMVDPDVLSACGLDPDHVSGFAFGVGVERVAMLRHGLPHIREFFEGDARLSAQF